ncbi:MAG: PIN domain-containing protein, partial [Oscillospiraceae bacterium]|nr:PIN domain-containing protein [Oscillospiraceae bacterium]
MRIFLIDFENVHSDGLTGVDFLSENDEVVIFHSNNADTITFEMMHKLMFSKAKLTYYKVKRGGRNALDFQMSSFLGYLIKTNSETDAEFFLISKDNGFDFVIDFWESGNTDSKPNIRRFYTIKAAFAPPSKSSPRQSVRASQPVQTPAAETKEIKDEEEVATVIEVSKIPTPAKPIKAVEKTETAETTAEIAPTPTEVAEVAEIAKVAEIAEVEQEEIPLPTPPPARRKSSPRPAKPRAVKVPDKTPITEVPTEPQSKESGTLADANNSDDYSEAI